MVSSASAPLVSVIVPAYNAQDSLGATLESLLAQDYAPFEIVVVDDGSTDATRAVAATFPTIRCLEQPNQGPAVARNTGMAAARGEFFAFVDADDLVPGTKLRVQAGFLVEHPSVGCVLGRQEIVLDGVEAPSWMTHDAIYGDLDGIPLISAMVRRSVIDEIGGFDPAFVPSEDRDLIVRMKERGIEVSVLPDLVLYRRFHGSNLSFHRPAKHPLLRSLKAKIDRGREGQEEER